MKTKSRSSRRAAALLLAPLAALHAAERPKHPAHHRR
jgi:hypothetical protein